MNFFKNIFFVAIILMLTSNAGNAQIKNNQDSVKKEKYGKIFGIIYGGFYQNISESYTPPIAAFEVKTGIIGYKNQFAENVDASIMLDVSKTTRDIKHKSDTAIISFTEGNNYTAYLKLAEIHWKICNNAELSLGQLLSSQYMLTQDKFWDHRFMQYTFQEVWKYGNPADFGARLKVKVLTQIAISIGMFNGDGPARWQDDKSRFLYCGDIEFRCSDSLIFRVYSDYKEITGLSSVQKPQSLINAFGGYIIDKFKVGAEYTYIHHAAFSDKDVMGGSAFVSYRILKTLELLARYDYFKDMTFFKENHFMLAGIQYEPAKNFFLSLNYRELWPVKTAQIYLNFGAKF